MSYQLLHGDCLEVMRSLPDNSVDSIVTDPPAGIGFMGKEWDKDKGGRDSWVKWMCEIATEANRVLKPGGHALVWALPRTSHWTATAWEDAGFEVRDRVAHVFGSGFPKSHDVAKAVQKAEGIELKDTGIISPISRPNTKEDLYKSGKVGKNFTIKEVTTEAAKQWEGWGTALKPAMEDWWLLRKPLIGTVADNVLEYGTGAINIDGCRVNPGEEVPGGGRSFGACDGVNEGWKRPSHSEYEGKPAHTSGRWPAHLIHDGSEEVLEYFPQAPGQQRATTGLEIKKGNVYGKFSNVSAMEPRDKGGSAARFFYCPKPSRAERNRGLEEFEEKPRNTDFMKGMEMKSQPNGLRPMKTVPRANVHPTVKSIALMRYLCRLITPPEGTVLDCFMGSGTTGIAAKLEGFSFIGIEREEEYLNIARARIDAWEPEEKPAPLPTLFDQEEAA